MAKPPSKKNDSSATIGFEAKLWLTADKLRNNMDAAEYKHVVLGLIFLKYISDTFEEHRAKLLAGRGDYEGANPEDPDEYKAENVFWVPADARWSHLQASAKQPTIGKNGGQFYTPSCVVRCLVEMLAAYKGRIYDPACGSGGMFVQSEKFVASHGGKLGDISIYGQESNATTRRLAVMNLALRGIEADFGPEHADTFRRTSIPTCVPTTCSPTRPSTTPTGTGGTTTCAGSSACRPRATPTSPGCSTSSTTWRPTAWPASCSPMAAFDRHVAPIFDKAFTNTLESRTLATLRDTLLPKLLSGELSVGNAVLSSARK